MQWTEALNRSINLYTMVFLHKSLSFFHGMAINNLVSYILSRFMLFQGMEESRFHQYGENFTQSIRFQEMLCGYVLLSALSLAFPS